MIMKKVFLIGCFAILAVAIAVTLSVNYNSDNDLFPVSLANLEALADPPTTEVSDDLLFGKSNCYFYLTSSPMHTAKYCGTCTYIPGTGTLLIPLCPNK